MANRLFLSFYFLLIGATIGFAQNNSVSTLEERLPNTEGNERISTLHQLWEALENEDPKKASKYAEEARKLSKDMGFDVLQMQSAYQIAKSAKKLGQRPKTIRFAKEALTLAQKQGDEKLELEILAFLMF